MGSRGGVAAVGARPARPQRCGRGARCARACTAHRSGVCAGAPPDDEDNLGLKTTTLTPAAGQHLRPAEERRAPGRHLIFQRFAAMQSSRCYRCAPSPDGFAGMTSETDKKALLGQLRIDRTADVRTAIPRRWWLVAGV